MNVSQKEARELLIKTSNFLGFYPQNSKNIHNTDKMAREMSGALVCALILYSKFHPTKEHLVDILKFEHNLSTGNLPVDLVTKMLELISRDNANIEFTIADLQIFGTGLENTTSNYLIILNAIDIVTLKIARAKQIIIYGLPWNATPEDVEKAVETPHDHRNWSN